MKLKLDRLQLKFKSLQITGETFVTINISGVKEIVAEKVLVNSNEGKYISFAEQFEIDIDQYSYLDGRQKLTVSVFSSGKVVALGHSGLRDLIPSLNDDFDFTIDLIGNDEKNGLIMLSGVIFDFEALREELRQKTNELDYLKSSMGGTASEFSTPIKPGDSHSQFSSSMAANEELLKKLSIADNTIAQLKLDLEESYTSKYESELALKNTISSMTAKFEDQQSENDRNEVMNQNSEERDADKKRIADLESTVKASQTFIHNMSEEKKQVHQAVSETNAAAAEFLYQLELQNNELSDQIQIECDSKQQMESDLSLCRGNLKRSLDQLKSQVDINERLMCMLKSVQMQSDAIHLQEDEENNMRMNGAVSEMKQQ